MARKRKTNVQKESKMSPLFQSRKSSFKLKRLLKKYFWKRKMDKFNLLTISKSKYKNAQINEFNEILRLKSLGDETSTTNLNTSFSTEKLPSDLRDIQLCPFAEEESVRNDHDCPLIEFRGFPRRKTKKTIDQNGNNLDRISIIRDSDNDSDDNRDREIEHIIKNKLMVKNFENEDFYRNSNEINSNDIFKMDLNDLIKMYHVEFEYFY